MRAACYTPVHCRAHVPCALRLAAHEGAEGLAASALPSSATAADTYAAVERPRALEWSAVMSSSESPMPGAPRGGGLPLCWGPGRLIRRRSLQSASAATGHPGQGGTRTGPGRAGRICRPLGGGAARKTVCRCWAGHTLAAPLQVAADTYAEEGGPERRVRVPHNRHVSLQDTTPP